MGKKRRSKVQEPASFKHAERPCQFIVQAHLADEKS